MVKTGSDARITERPADLPDYANPPLVEVVIDTQFAPIPDYKQIHAAEIWALFKEEFPIVEEHPPLSPSFETFGSSRQPQFNVQVIDKVMPARLWFISKEGDHLIQFQPDRFIRNWRKHHDERSRYPRFENIFESFREEFSKLDDFSKKKFSHRLAINQCEVRYVNHIRVPDDEQFRTEDYFIFGDFGDFEIDDFRVIIKRTVRDTHENPIFRLGCECGITFNKKGDTVVRLDVFARGAPSGPSLTDVEVFCLQARKEIVGFFTEITTKKAHKIWGRVQ